MLICDSFVVLNMPKTGSTFVRTVIKEIYRRREERGIAHRGLQEVLVPNLEFPGRPPDQHGTCRQIPEWARGRTVVSVLRNPFEKFRSTFEERFWARFPPLAKEELARFFPHFPDLDFDDYVLLNVLACKRRVPGGNPHDIGSQTFQFFRMYFRDPIGVLTNLTPGYLDDETSYRDDMEDVVFLRQESLSYDLADFLARRGFTSEEVNLCRESPRVNVNPRGRKQATEPWSELTARYVLHNERFLLRVLRELGFAFSHPGLSGGASDGAVTLEELAEIHALNASRNRRVVGSPG